MGVILETLWSPVRVCVCVCLCVCVYPTTPPRRQWILKRFFYTTSARYWERPRQLFFQNGRQHGGHIKNGRPRKIKSSDSGAIFLLNKEKPFQKVFNGLEVFGIFFYFN